jgi:TonB family protein
MLQPVESPLIRAQAISVALHVVAAILLMVLPWDSFQPQAIPYKELPEVTRHVTPLVAPPAVLTQRAPNRGRVGREFDLESLLPQQARVASPAPPAPPPGVRKPGPPGPPEAPKPQPAAKLPVPDAPPVESPIVAQAPPPLGVPNPVTPPPPPQIQPQERESPFERPGFSGGRPSTGLGNARVSPPSQTIDEAVRATARNRSGSGLVVGDTTDESTGLGDIFNQRPTSGRNASSLELLSDPAGADFHPYLVRILAAVKQNWLAVYPESARMGRRGRVQIQFAINRRGDVPKLVIAMPSGTDALDRAAVAGISASTPFPPLPKDFRGEQVRLQFTFSYNLPK